MADQELEACISGDFANMSFEFRAAYLLAYKLAESGCPGCSAPSQHVFGLFQAAYEEFKKLPQQSDQ